MYPPSSYVGSVTTDVNVCFSSFPFTSWPQVEGCQWYVSSYSYKLLYVCSWVDVVISLLVVLLSELEQPLNVNPKVKNKVTIKLNNLFFIFHLLFT